jgi:hypothetical protein
MSALRHIRSIVGIYPALENRRLFKHVYLRLTAPIGYEAAMKGKATVKAGSPARACYGERVRMHDRTWSA